MTGSRPSGGGREARRGGAVASRGLADATAARAEGHVDDVAALAPPSLAAADAGASVRRAGHVGKVGQRAGLETARLSIKGAWTST